MSKLEIVRLLHNWQDKVRQLAFINDNLESAGRIGEKLLCEADPLIIAQRLAELYLLVFLGSRKDVSSTAAMLQPGKHHDIDLSAGGKRAKIEIFSPVEDYGFRFVKLYSQLAFRYSECSRGFCGILELVVPTQCGYHARQIPNEDRDLRRWLATLVCKVNSWLTTAKEGNDRIFKGVDDSFELKATLCEVYDNPQRRDILLYEPGRSNDIRQFFEMSPEETAWSQVEKKILSKLNKRQCGKSDPDCLRILVLNFSLADDSADDWFCWTKIARQMEETVKKLATEIGPPIPVDIVLPARLWLDCCFGEAIVLDPDRKEQIKQLMAQTGLDQKCFQQKLEPLPTAVTEGLSELESEARLNYRLAKANGEPAVPVREAIRQMWLARKPG